MIQVRRADERGHTQCRGSKSRPRSLKMSPLWSLREELPKAPSPRPRAPVRREAQVPSKRKRRFVFSPGRSARSLPEGRSLALRERERVEGPGSRSRPHPAEPRADAPAGAGPEQAEATA